MGYGSDICTGGTASAARSYSGSYLPALAFDDKSATYWDGYPWVNTDWIKYDLGAGVTKTATKYTIKIYSTVYPTQWKFQGSNNDSDWTDINTQTGQTFTSGQKRAFTFSNTTAYRYYRWLLEALNTGNEPTIAELEIMESDNTFVAPGPLDVQAGLSGPPEFQLAVGALDVAAALSAGDIYNGYLVDNGVLDMAAGLDASLLLTLVPGALDVAAGLSVTKVEMPIVVAPGPLAAVSGLACTSAAMLPEITGITTYECVLTGDAESPELADIAIPISSFQGRFRSGDPSYLAVVVPGMDYADAINERSNGDLLLYIIKTDGAYSIRQLLLAVDLEEISTDEGSTSQSITLSGHRTETFSAKTVVFDDVYYETIRNGLKRFRCPPDLYLNPGDTVVIDGQSITADLITWAVSVGQCTMEIAEEA